eukprot:s3132_g10.t1
MRAHFSWPIKELWRSSLQSAKSLTPTSQRSLDAWNATDRARRPAHLGGLICLLSWSLARARQGEDHADLLGGLFGDHPEDRPHPAGPPTLGASLPPFMVSGKCQPDKEKIMQTFLEETPADL